MPRFKGGASGLSPLAIQLRPTTPGSAGVYSAEVVGWYAGVEVGPQGSVVSRPVISRPSLLGTASGTRQPNIIGVSNPAAVSISELLTAFGTQPSLPAVTTYTITEPWDVQWAAAPGSGLLVLSGGGILLYAKGGAWNGQIEWDEP